MLNKIFCLLDDKKKIPGLRTYYKDDKNFFEAENKKGFGVYFAVNEFDVDLTSLKNNETARQDKYCSRIRYVYADLDIAKAGDGTTRNEKEKRKQLVIMELLEKCEPTMIIDTSNGLQPLWEIKDGQVTEESKKLYTKIIKGVIEWSKEYGCKADGVFDTARILRRPDFYHQKEGPYLCKVIHKSEKKYSLKEMEEIFPFEEKKQVIIQNVKNEINLNPVFDEIEKIDFQELVIKAFAAVGRPVSFDKSGHLLDPVGGTTGTFIGRIGERKNGGQYLASSSHEPFKGNRISATAQIMNIDYSDAYKWICKEYNLDFKELIKKENVKKQIEKIETIKEPILKTKKRYTWGTRNLDTSLAIIKPGNFIVVAAKSGSGKTTFVFDMAIKNAYLGHKVLFLSLEMDEEDILDDFGRKHAGITIEEELDYKIPDFKQKAYENKKTTIRQNSNLIIKGIRRNGDIQWETIEEIIKQTENITMVFIDNLDLIGSKDKESDLDRQKRIIKNILNFTSETKLPLVLIHHYRKSPADQKTSSLDDMSGSGKIRDGADRIIKITRNSDINAEYPNNFLTQVSLQKGRGYPECSRDVYFIRGTFVDIPPSKYEYEHYDFSSDKQLIQFGENKPEIEF